MLFQAVIAEYGFDCKVRKLSDYRQVLCSLAFTPDEKRPKFTVMQRLKAVHQGHFAIQ